MIKIMHVDDDSVVRMITAQALDASGQYQVMGCETAKDCINKYNGFKPDLILIDYVLPDMEGSDLAKRLNSIAAAQGRRVPVIVVSGNDQDSLGKNFERIEVLGYIKKPYSPEEIVSQVNALWDSFDAASNT